MSGGTELVAQLEAAHKDQAVMEDTIFKLTGVAKLADGRRKALAGVMQAVNQINTTIASLLTEGD